MATTVEKKIAEFDLDKGDLAGELGNYDSPLTSQFVNSALLEDMNDAVFRERPSVLEYNDFRLFLKHSFMFLKFKNPSYSETAFIKQAGFGNNSRGYFNLIVKGKRNLSPKTVLGFIQALKLHEKESLYFENLVNYNQAKTERDKAFYFAKFSMMLKGKKSRAFELLKSQYNCLSNWYILAIKELISLDDFSESPDWIIKKLKKKITRREIKGAINDLLNLGIVKRDTTGKLVHSSKFLNFSDNSLNYTVVNKFHTQILDLSKAALREEPYERRSASSLLLACDSEAFNAIREDIRHFRDELINKYSQGNKKVDCVVCLGIQFFPLTHQG